MDVHECPGMDVHGPPWASIPAMAVSTKGKTGLGLCETGFSAPSQTGFDETGFHGNRFYSNRFSYPSPGKPVRLPISGSVCGHRDILIVSV